LVIEFSKSNISELLESGNRVSLKENYINNFDVFIVCHMTKLQ